MAEKLNDSVVLLLTMKSTWEDELLLKGKRDWRAFLKLLCGLRRSYSS